ncbi:MAG: prepilin-type N-terminal cleavage/methylation domain-containing protein, partial [Candidatus Eisenbacteria sp.]|nr:prepilin-type N-terminal cleavage/methylation domain-containing protein [Candidatus Eisenbacteria bacterium]
MQIMRSQRPRNHCKCAGGFTLVEMMVAVTILAIVSFGLYQVLMTSRDSYERQKATLEMQQNSRTAIEALAEDFRHVSYGKDPTQPSITYAGPDSVVFVADIIPSLSGAESITYFLSSAGDPDTPNPNDTVLMKTVADSGGIPVFSEPQSYGIKVGGLSFRYFNGAGVELANPVPQPELIGEALIEVTAVEPRAHKVTGTYTEETLSTTIYPRNLPLTPSRSRPSTPIVGPLNSPNCESVTVPWTTPATNTDGTPLAFSDISHFTVYFGTQPDTMSLFSRIARTINQWTVPGLTSGQTYYLGVTCTSRSGVESHMGMDNIYLSSSLFPQAPTGLTWTADGAAGIRLDWSIVSLYTNGTNITTPVDYHVYRDTGPGVTPSVATYLATAEVQNWFVDDSPVTCTQYYYIVTAAACANESAASSEINASRPLAPDYVGTVLASLTEVTGQIHVTWALPTHRADGSPLPLGEISGSRIYYDTSSQTYTNFVDVAGTDTTYTLSGLQTCITYYINVACADVCPHLGDLLPSNEVAINTSEPCDPDIPVAASFLRMTGMDQRVDLAWPANQTDCDLYGYRVFYDIDPGPPYTGVGATQGASPITFQAAAITSGDTCRVSLTGLNLCQGYAAVVTVIDGCDPPNESTFSPEAAASTECLPCAIDAACPGYVTSGPAAPDVHLELYPKDATQQTLDKLIGHWCGPNLIAEVWAGRPLVCLWNSDGSAGGDGPVGDQPTATELDLDDVTVPAAATRHDGLPLKLVFDSDMAGHDLLFDFVAPGGICSSLPRMILDGFIFDDFDDGNPDGWTFTNGSWAVVDGELFQSTSDNSCFAIHNGSY